jgi:hypothetical protein
MRFLQVPDAVPGWFSSLEQSADNPYRHTILRLTSSVIAFTNAGGKQIPTVGSVRRNQKCSVDKTPS